VRFEILKKPFIALLVLGALAACKSSEERAADHFENGVALMEEGDNARAIVEFRNTLKYDRSNAEAFRNIGQIHLQKKRARPAYRHYLGVVELLPNDTEGRTVLSELAFVSKNWDEFERHAKVAIELDPDAPKVQAIGLASQYRAAVLNNDNAAREAIVINTEALITEQPENEILRQILVDGYISQEKFPEAVAQIDKLIEINPETMELYAAKLELLAKNGDEAKVEAELRKMVVTFPEDTNVKSTLLRFLVSREKTDEAEAFLRELIAESTDDERDDAYASLVQFLLQVNGPEAALVELEKEITDKPDADTLRALRASIKFDTGDRDQGIAELQEIIGAETPNLATSELQDVTVTLAKMLVTVGNDVGARKLIEEVLAVDGNAVGALKMQATWMIREDNTEDAINALRIALDQEPQDAEAMTIMAQAYEREGNTDLMQNFLSLAVEASNNAPTEALRYANVLVRDEKFIQAETVLINALRLAPGNIDLLSMLGRVYLQLDDRGRADQVIKTLRELDTETAKSNADAINLELLARGSDTGQALEFLEGLAQQDGDGAMRAKLALLRTRLQSGDTDEAIAYARDLVAEDPKSLQFRNALALTYTAARDYDSAETELRTMLEQDATAVPAWTLLARLSSIQNDPQAALSVINEGLEAVPGASELLWGKASFLQNEGDIDGAIEIYEELYQTASSSTVVANNLASLLSTFRSDDASLERAEVIARRLQGTEVPPFQDTYGWILHRSGNYREALSYLEPAATGLPRDASVQFHLGMTYAALERREEALSQLRRAIEIAGPLGSDQLMDEARAKIAELEATAETQQ